MIILYMKLRRLNSAAHICHRYFYCHIHFLKDSSEVTKDAQKKSKRKGRNRQEVVTVNKLEAEPEIIKTPIDERRVSPS